QMPWVRLSVLAVSHRPNEIYRRYQKTKSKDRRTGRRQYIEDLKLRWVSVIPPWHPQVAGNELRQEGQVETDKDHQRRKPAPTFGIHPAADLGPPVMQAAEITKECAANHDVVEVGHDEIGITDMHIDGERCEKQPGHAANSEKADETERVKHRRVVGDR